MADKGVLPGKQWPDFTLTTGPSGVSSQVLNALAKPVVYHYDPMFLAFYEETCAKLKKIFLTKNDLIVVQGDAVLALEAAAASCIRPGDQGINVVSGYYGKAYEGCITANGGTVVEVAAPYDQSVRPEMVEAAIKANPGVRFLSMVHSETPSTTVNPVKDICGLAKEYGLLTVVDSVSGLGGCEVRPDEWGIDICIAGSQKCLGAPPGLSPVSVSAFAWEAMRRKNPARGSVLCLLDWKERWLEKRSFPLTPSVNLMYALDAAADEYLAEGQEAVWKRHDLCAKAAREGLKALGLKLWAAGEDIAANCATGFKNPEGVDAVQFIAYLRSRFGLQISAGLLDHVQKLYRLGHMGFMARPALIPLAVSAIGRSFEAFGCTVDTAAGTAAAAAAVI
jgi:pyridoxamine--pyruvate transaminase